MPEMDPYWKAELLKAKRAVAEAEEILNQVMSDANKKGRIPKSAIADLLGVNRNTVWRRTSPTGQESNVPSFEGDADDETTH